MIMPGPFLFAVTPSQPSGPWPRLGAAAPIAREDTASIPSDCRTIRITSFRSYRAVTYQAHNAPVASEPARCMVTLGLSDQDTETSARRTSARIGHMPGA